MIWRDQQVAYPIMCVVCECIRCGNVARRRRREEGGGGRRHAGGRR